MGIRAVDDRTALYCLAGVSGRPEASRMMTPAPGERRIARMSRVERRGELAFAQAHDEAIEPGRIARRCRGRHRRRRTGNGEADIVKEPSQRPDEGRLQVV